MMWRAVILAAMMPVMTSGEALAAGDRFYPPEGCTEALTVQSRGCTVTNVWTCESDAAGDRWGLHLGANGPQHLGRIDDEAQWVESYDFNPSRVRTLILPAEDPHNLSELLDAGVDTFDFELQHEGFVERVQGFDRLTGNSVEIDGETLLETEITARFLRHGEVRLTITGNEYVSEKHRRFFSGVRFYDFDGRVIEEDNTPVDFIYPGEPGFFARAPLYDCDATLARAALIRKGTQ